MLPAQGQIRDGKTPGHHQDRERSDDDRVEGSDRLCNERGRRSDRPVIDHVLGGSAGNDALSGEAGADVLIEDAALPSADYKALDFTLSYRLALIQTHRPNLSCR
jgi:hypothetical protein